MRKVQEEERQRKEEERRKRIAEEKEREAERERKRREKEEKAKLERREREERERRVREEKEAKLAAERAARKEQQEREERERKLAKEREEKERAEREKAEKEKAEKDRLEKEKADKEARDRLQAQQRAAAKATRPPTSPRNATASGSTQRSSSNPSPSTKKNAGKPLPPAAAAAAAAPVVQPLRQQSQPRPQLMTTSQPLHIPQPLTPQLPQHIPSPLTPMFSPPQGILSPPAMSPRVQYVPPGPFGASFPPNPSIPQIPPALAPSAVPRGFGTGPPFDPGFSRGLAPPAPIAPPSKAAQNPLASPTQLAPRPPGRRPSMVDLGPIGRPVPPIAPPPIAPIARPPGEPGGSGSTSPSRRSPSPKGVLGSSALAADDDEIVTAPVRRTVPPGAVGWGPSTASPRSSGPDMRAPWAASGTASGYSQRPPLWNAPSGPGPETWHTTTSFFGTPYTNHDPSPPPHSGS
jgi:hypothetical protein